MDVVPEEKWEKIESSFEWDENLELLEYFLLIKFYENCNL
jgi:hypothetical protein